MRVLRGGSYWNTPENLRAANRNNNNPDNENRNNGFRCVVGPPGQHAMFMERQRRAVRGQTYTKIEIGKRPQGTSHARTAREPSGARNPSPARSGRPVPNVRAGSLPPPGVLELRSIPAGSFQRLSDPVALWRAWRRCRQGRRRKPDIARFDVDADRHVLSLHRALQAGSWTPGPYRLRLVRDPKPRCITIAPIGDRIVHQAIVTELAPHYARGFAHHSFGCLEGRGPHRAVLCALGWMRRYRWRLALDVASYFASVRHDVLLGLYRRRLRDRDTLALLTRVVQAGGQVYQVPWVAALVHLPGNPAVSQTVRPGANGGQSPVGCSTRSASPADLTGRGIPVGSFVSHFSGALYLDGLDHFLRRELHLPAALRYMDDLLLMADDEATLLRAREAVAVWLHTQRGLRLKDPAARPRDNRQPMTFLGYRVSRSGVAPSKKLRRNFRRNLRRAAESGPEALRRTVSSYRGLLAF